jgi:hypothetical protein
VTLESTFPWLSLLAAAGAGAAAGGRPRTEAALKAAALGALALYAYFRWIAPTAISMALCLQAVAETILPRGSERWRSPKIAVAALGWLVLANLYAGTGDGPGVFITDAGKAGLAAALLIGGGYGLWRVSARGEWGLGLAVLTSALGLMAGAALTLDWGFWPVLIGVGAVLASEALALYVQAGLRLAETPAVRRIVWALAFLGQVAMAYGFLR